MSTEPAGRGSEGGGGTAGEALYELLNKIDFDGEDESAVRAMAGSQHAKHLLEKFGVQKTASLYIGMQATLRELVSMEQRANMQKLELFLHSGYIQIRGRDRDARPILVMTKAWRPEISESSLEYALYVTLSLIHI